MEITSPFDHLRYFYVINRISCGFSAVWLLSIPASEKNQIIGDFSTLQLLTFVVTLVCAVILLTIAWKLFKGNQELTQAITTIENKRSIWISIFFAKVILTWFVFTLDELLPHTFTGYLQRLTPQLVWLKTTLVIALLFWLFRNMQLIRNDEGKPALKQAAIGLVLLAVPGLLILLTGEDMSVSGNNAPTVRLEFSQLFFTIVIIFFSGLVQWFIGSKSWKQKGALGLQIIIAIGIYLFAVFAWNGAEFRENYSMTGPFPPTGDFVPSIAADAFRMDIPGQMALVGNSFDAKNYVDNPGYALFLMFCRAVNGQEYKRTILIQILLLALLPVFIFFIGDQFGSSMGGLAAALLLIFREVNMTETAGDHWMLSVKVFATEPFITFVLCASVFFFILWLKNLRQKLPLFLAGGLFGYSTLVRANSWFFLVAMGVLVLIKFRKSFKKIIAYSILLGVSVAVIILPWMWQSQQSIGTPFYMVFRFTGSVVGARYQSSEWLDEDSESSQADLSVTSQDTTEDVGSPIVGVISNIAKHSMFSYMNSYYLMPGLQLLPHDPQQPMEDYLSVFPVDQFAAWKKVSVPIKLLYLCWWGGHYYFYSQWG